VAVAAPAQVQVQIGFGGGAGGGIGFGGAVGGPMIAWPGGMGGNGAITVVDGKPETVPTCYQGSVRIRALKQPRGFGGIGIPVGIPGAGPKDDEHTVWMEVRAEPKLQVQNLQSVTVEKAVDDQDQKLGQVAPAAGGPFPGGPGGAVPIRRLPPVMFSGMGTLYYAVNLKKGEKEAKALKEFAGAINASVVPPGEPLVTADKITKAAGKTFKGKDGGQIKVTEVKEEDINRVVRLSREEGGQVKNSEVKEEFTQITVQFQLEQPQNVIPANAGGIGGGMMGGMGGVMPGGPPIKGVPVPLPAPAPAAPAKAPRGAAGFALQAAAAPAVQIGVAGGGGVGIAPGGGIMTPGGFLYPAPGITLVDDKGKTIAQTGGAQPNYQFVPGGQPTVTYTQEYRLEKGQQPAKLVFSGSKITTIDIPFSFKDVPLK
jgi:hypothetical protein